MKYCSLPPGVYIWFNDEKFKKRTPPAKILLNYSYKAVKERLPENPSEVTLHKYGPLICFYCNRQWRWPAPNKPYPCYFCQSVLYCSLRCFNSDYKLHFPICVKIRKLRKKNVSSPFFSII
jgi:hypothetical protein